MAYNDDLKKKNAGKSGAQDNAAARTALPVRSRLIGLHCVQSA